MEEIEKFRGSDIVIYQMPIYWFSFPHFTKKYIDEVYLYNVFFTSSEKYGHGGLMKGKKYMFSLTWNATYDAFKIMHDDCITKLKSEKKSCLPSFGV